MPSSEATAEKNSWRHTQFEPWGEDNHGGAEEEGGVTAGDVLALGEPCKMVLRCRQARTPWEKVVRAVVGEPVHVDVVMARQDSASARFCFSSYMNQKFEMTMMSPALVHDDSVSNWALDVTEEEHERCIKFLTALDGKASYSYFDALVLMPMAPKPNDGGSSKKNFLSAIFNTLAEDEETVDPAKIKKVFCSQSVVLMLRYALDPQGRNSGLLNALSSLNSRLVSPQQVQHLLQEYGASPLSNDELAAL